MWALIKVKVIFLNCLQAKSRLTEVPRSSMNDFTAIFKIFPEKISNSLAGFSLHEKSSSGR